MATQIRTRGRVYSVSESVEQVQGALNKVLGEGTGGPFVTFTDAKTGGEVSVKATDVDSVQGSPGE